MEATIPPKRRGPGPKPGPRLDTRPMFTIRAGSPETTRKRKLSMERASRTRKMYAMFRAGFNLNKRQTVEKTDFLVIVSVKPKKPGLRTRFKWAGTGDLAARFHEGSSLLPYKGNHVARYEMMNEGNKLSVTSRYSVGTPFSEMLPGDDNVQHELISGEMNSLQQQTASSSDHQELNDIPETSPLSMEDILQPGTVLVEEHDMLHPDPLLVKQEVEEPENFSLEHPGLLHSDLMSVYPQGEPLFEQTDMLPPESMTPQDMLPQETVSGKTTNQGG